MGTPEIVLGGVACVETAVLAGIALYQAAKTRVAVDAAVQAVADARLARIDATAPFVVVTATADPAYWEPMGVPNYQDAVRTSLEGRTLGDHDAVAVAVKFTARNDDPTTARILLPQHVTDLFISPAELRGMWGGEQLQQFQPVDDALRANTLCVLPPGAVTELTVELIRAARDWNTLTDTPETVATLQIQDGRVDGILDTVDLQIAGPPLVPAGPGTWRPHGPARATRGAAQPTLRRYKGVKDDAGQLPAVEDLTAVQASAPLLPRSSGPTM